jgi:flagellar basal-body rod modification protein FlgD
MIDVSSLITQQSTTNSAAAVSAASGAAGSAESAQQLSDRFLKLLVAQMNNQDPLNPLDNSQITSQMAQISTVTGINTMSDTVTQLLNQFAQMQSLQAAQLTGHSVLVAGNSLTLDASGAAIGGVQLAAPADAVSVQITDANGTVVRTLPLGQLATGVNTFHWDGKTDSGTQAAAGNYAFTVTATAAGQAVTTTALAAHQVEGVSQDGTTVQLILSGVGATPYSAIKQIL